VGRVRVVARVGVGVDVPVILTAAIHGYPRFAAVAGTYRGRSRSTERTAPGIPNAWSRRRSVREVARRTWRFLHSTLDPIGDTVAEVCVPRVGVEPSRRVRLAIRGAVQGVGFRPFVYRLAADLGLHGWVGNSAQGVEVEIEGDAASIDRFLARLDVEKPPRSFIQSREAWWLDPAGYTRFEIRASDPAGARTALVLPDLATCPECLAEVLDATNRRHRYPFTNCTNCGPRFSVIEALPYDRSATTMRRFTMCAACRAEYDDPMDRRFHAEPNACADCGPHVSLWDTRGGVLAERDDALRAAAAAVRAGAIVAIKGLGGFQLLADARREDSVRSLRQRKRREEKPFALMFPALEAVEAACDVSAPERRLLTSPEAPVVLLRRRPGEAVAASVAPRNPWLGVMLPYTPLHHLLMSDLAFPVVATSGNVSDEPICTDERDARERLRGVADVFLVHDRPIARHVDDSIARVVLGRELVLRRARGYAPLPIQLGRPLRPVLAVGAHLKNAIATSVGQAVFVSQHIGDLETPEACEAFHRVIGSFEQLYGLDATALACDAHPDYHSTRFARQDGRPVTAVQHHYAHVLSCMAENDLDGDVLGVAWDGSGYGLDGTVWGGEFLGVTATSFRRVAHFRTFRLPGGDTAAREPRRSALGVLYEIFGDALLGKTALAPLAAFAPRELPVLHRMLARGLNAPLTSSAGRLFDAVAALAGVRQVARYEGQAAMELEFALDGVATTEAYPVRLRPGPSADIVDWEPLIHRLLADLDDGVAAAHVAARFHNALVDAIVAVAMRAEQDRVVLTGGCFQNRYLLERAVHRLRAAGFRPYWHQRIPPNDGGIPLGQIVAATRSATTPINED
jgi:hydrogenase maturation protein HypF